MSGPFGSSQWMYSSGGFYPTEIEQSLRFNDDDSAYLSWTPASAGNRKTWTWSGWVKRGNLSSTQTLFHAGNGSTDTTWLDITLNSDRVRLSLYNTLLRTSSAVLRDTSAWYHIVVHLDTTAATAADRVKVYVNGVEIVNFDDNNNPSLNDEYAVNTATQHNTGRSRSGAYLDGYMAEVNFIDGQALDPTDFGEFKSGVWVAKSYAGSYGTNGFYLNFSDSANIGDDLSGNANDWTANNLVATDVVLDSPTQNWCVLNSTNTAGATLSEGNLKYVSASSGYTPSVSTFGNASGKWYWEVNFVSGSLPLIGVVDETWSVTSGNAVGYLIGPDGVDSIAYYSDGRKFINGSGTSYGASFTTGDIIGVALDLDSNEITFYKNGVSQGAISYTFSGNFILPAVSDGSNSASATLVANFGQDSSFAGNKTAQGNTDDNGVGDFYYAPPSGYLALCTANLPDPVIDPAQDDVPSDYFNISLWTGNGTSQSITGLTFQPDLVWGKNRDFFHGNVWTDAVRGVNSQLFSNTTNAENTNTDNITSFNSDGFSVGSSANYNDNTRTYVAWNWLAGNGTSSNTDGSITSTVSVNQKAGFSVTAYTAAGSTATVGHGLGAEPSMIIIKNRTAPSGYNWNVYHKSIGNTQRVLLDGTSAAISGVWNNTSPTSSVFTIGGSAVYDSGDYIAYCFAEVEGYSKFGSYTGNGSTDGPMIWTGFRPAWVMIKRTDSTQNWSIVDTSRDTYNIANKRLFANLNSAEDTGIPNFLDLLSNGFKCRDGNVSYNASGGSYIFMSFASNPFKYSTAR